MCAVFFHISHTSIKLFLKRNMYGEEIKNFFYCAIIVYNIILVSNVQHTDQIIVFIIKWSPW